MQSRLNDNNRPIDTQLVGSVVQQGQANGSSGVVPASTQAPVKSYVDIYKEYSPYSPPSAEQVRKEMKRQKAREVLSAVGDGLSALSNLYHTTRYAPNVDQSRLQLSARNQQRWKELQAKREAERREWEAGYRRALEMDKQQANADRDFAFRQGQAELQQKNWREQFDENGRRWNIEQDYRKGRDKIGDERYDKEYKLREEQHKQGLKESDHRMSLSSNSDAREAERHGWQRDEYHRAKTGGGSGSGSVSGASSGASSTGGGGSRGSSNGQSFVFGQDGRGVFVPNHLVDSWTEVMWQHLPEGTKANYRAAYKGNNPTPGAMPSSGGLTPEQKRMAIASALHNNAHLQQKAIEALGGTGGYMLGSGMRQSQIEEVWSYKQAQAKAQADAKAEQARQAEAEKKKQAEAKAQADAKAKADANKGPKKGFAEGFKI